MTAGDPTFQGYQRASGQIGIRNNVLVLPSVLCSRLVAERIADTVTDAVSAPHDHGCGQIGADKEQTARTYQGIATNPNVAGTVVVGLGCESIQSDAVAATLADLDRPVRELSIQDVGGTDACIEAGVSATRELVDHAKSAQRVSGALGDLTLGIVSSDLHPSTVDQAEPLVGSVVRDIVASGGRVVVAGTDRLLPHRKQVLEAATADAKEAVTELFDRLAGQPPRSRQVHRGAKDRSFDELSSLWDGLPIRDAIRYGAPARHSTGVALIDAPAQFGEAATGLAAAGAQMVLHITADGVPTGHPIVPTLKLSANQATLNALDDDIDVDARAADPDSVRDRIRGIADGELVRAETHGLTSFAITRVGPSM